MKKKMGLVLIAGLLLSSCAYHETRWAKAGVSEAERNHAFLECSIYGDAHSEMNPFMAILITQDCMRLKGFVKR
jgi:hypothetical protein